MHLFEKSKLNRGRVEKHLRNLWEGRSPADGGALAWGARVARFNRGRPDSKDS